LYVAPKQLILNLILQREALKILCIEDQDFVELLHGQG